MTTYAYRLTLNDREAITIEAGLKHYRNFCKSQMSDGPVAPYWAHLQSIDRILGKLHADTQMTSTSSHCWQNPVSESCRPFFYKTSPPCCYFGLSLPNVETVTNILVASNEQRFHVWRRCKTFDFAVASSDHPIFGRCIGLV
jgi:hypothetical protein